MDPITLAAAKKNTKQQIEELKLKDENGNIVSLKEAVDALNAAEIELATANNNIAKATEELSKSGLPQVTVDDNRKALIVAEGKWQVSTLPDELPQVGAEDVGKILQVDSNGKWIASLLERAEDNAF